MKIIKIRDEYIKLGQALKLADLVGSGAEAKIIIEEGNIKINGEVCKQRGKKLHPGDIFENDEIQVKVESYDN